MGTSITLSVNSLLRAGSSRCSLLRKVVRRSVLLFLIGIFIINPNYCQGPRKDKLIHSLFSVEPEEMTGWEEVLILSLLFLVWLFLCPGVSSSHFMLLLHSILGQLADPRRVAASCLVLLGRSQSGRDGGEKTSRHPHSSQPKAQFYHQSIQTKSFKARSIIIVLWM